MPWYLLSTWVFVFPKLQQILKHLAGSHFIKYKSLNSKEPNCTTYVPCQPVKTILTIDVNCSLSKYTYNSTFEFIMTPIVSFVYQIQTICVLISLV